jgi:hypothetical protein
MQEMIRPPQLSPAHCLYYSSHLHEVSIRQQQLPQWIIGVRIKPG